MRLRASLLLLGILCVAVGPACAQPDGRLYSMMQESTEVALQQQDDNSQATEPVFGKDLGARAKNASWSLVIPGWSQLRSGHKYRGAFFLTAEAAIWTSYIIFQSQGSSREGSYQDYAQNFAGVSSGDRDDDYWRSLGAYRSDGEYNEDRLRDLRAGIDPEGPEYGANDAWLWQSEQRFDEYNALRRDSNSAYDNADLILVFALVNRLVSFVDAMRDAPPGATDEVEMGREHMFESGGVGVDIGLGPHPQGGLASSLRLSHGF